MYKRLLEFLGLLDLGACQVSMFLKCDCFFLGHPLGRMRRVFVKFLFALCLDGQFFGLQLLGVQTSLSHNLFVVAFRFFYSLLKLLIDCFELPVHFLFVLMLNRFCCLFAVAGLLCQL